MKQKTIILLVLLLLSVFTLASCGEESGGVIERPGIDTPDGGNDNLNPPDDQPQEPDEKPQEPDEKPQEPDEKPQEPDEKPQDPFLNKDVLLKATTNGLNLRSGAGSTYSTVGTINKNDMVWYIGDDGEWYKTYYKNKFAYISKKYTEKVGFDKMSNSVEKVIDIGKKLLGIPYELGAQRLHWGNGNLNSNFSGNTYDCSSLMQYMLYYGANINIDTTSRSQSLQGQKIDRSELKRGDIIFFTNASRYNNSGLDRIGHVGMYFGDNYILHTSSDYAVIEPMSSTRWNYYINASRFVY